jgi:hypothetical protein
VRAKVVLVGVQLETSVGGGHVPQSTIAASAFKLSLKVM